MTGLGAVLDPQLAYCVAAHVVGLGKETTHAYARSRARAGRGFRGRNDRGLGIEGGEIDGPSLGTVLHLIAQFRAESVGLRSRQDLSDSLNQITSPH